MICSECRSTMTIGPLTWAETMRSERRNLGSTLEDVSFDAGCSFSHLSKVERGIEKPSARLQRRIEEALAMGVQANL